MADQQRQQQYNYPDFGYDIRALPDPDGFSLANMRNAARQAQPGPIGSVPYLRPFPDDIQRMMMQTGNSLANGGQEGFRQAAAGFQNYSSPNTQMGTEYRLQPPPREPRY